MTWLNLKPRAKVACWIFHCISTDKSFFTFYDLCRLNQTYADDSAADFLENEAVVVLQAVNRKNIARFAQTIFR